MEQIREWFARAAGLCLLVVCLSGSVLVAQDGDDTTQNGAAPKRWGKPKTPTAFERAGFTELKHWKLSDLALPEGMQREEGRFSVSPQHELFLRDPTMKGLLPAPAETWSEVWVTQREGAEAARGSYALLRYAERVPEDVAEMLPALLWGPEGVPTPDHPENLVVTGDFVILLSFASDDPTGDWLRAQLLERAGLRIDRTWAALRPQLIELTLAFADRDWVAVQSVFYAHADALQENSMAQFFAAEAGYWQQDWPRAEVHYSWVAYLDQEGIDAFAPDPASQWGLFEHYGVALLAQGKAAEAVPVLERALARAEEGGNPEAAAQSDYNLACAYSLTGALERAVTSLQSCAAFDPKYRDQARRDSDFDVLREREDFQAFLREIGG